MSFAARGELTCVVSSSRGGVAIWLFAVLGFPTWKGASYFEMLATSVAYFLALAAYLWMFGASKYASCPCLLKFTPFGVLHLLFLQQFAATFIACLPAPFLSGFPL